MKKLPLILAVIALLASGGWWYYTTTPDYLVAGIKKACSKNTFTEMAKEGIAHTDGETRELTSDEQAKMNEMFEKLPTEEECPFKDKKLVKEKLAAADLTRYGVTDGYKLTYEDDGKQRDIKILLFNGKWRHLLVEANFSLDAPATVTSPQAEFTSPEIQAGPESSVQMMDSNNAGMGY